MEFVIPVAKDDLLRETSAKQYSVAEIVDAEAISPTLNEFREAFTKRGPVELWNYFDTFFSVLKYFKTLPFEVKKEFWDYLLVCHNMHFDELQDYLEQAARQGHASVDNQRDHRNILLMNIFLLTQYAEAFENELSSNADACFKVPAIKGKRGGTQKPLKSRMKVSFQQQDEDGEAAEKKLFTADEWIEEKKRLLQTLTDTLKTLPLNLLWNPPVVDEQFVNVIANCCYKFLENPVSGRLRSANNNDEIFELLGVLIENYRHVLSASMKIVQLLHHFEHLPLVLALGVQRFATKNKTPLIVIEILRELSNIDSEDLAREGATAKNFANFIIELATAVPAAVLSNVDQIICHLESESYTLRNAILSVFEQLIEYKLTGEGLSHNDKATRDQFLESLEAHIHDRNAFTRAKVLHLWVKMAENKCVPLSRLKTVLPLIIGRLIDKAATVRKAAVQFLTVMLKGNPFLAQFKLEDVKEKYEAEKEKFQQMSAGRCERQGVQTSHGVVAKADAAWQRIEKAVDDQLEKWLDDNWDGENTLTPRAVMSQKSSVDTMLHAVYNMLEKANYYESCSFLILIRNGFPDHRVFVNWKVDGGKLDLEEIKCYMLDSLKTTYLENFYVAAINENPGDEIMDTDISDDIDDFNADRTDEIIDEDTEFTRQRRLVQFLREAHIFATQILTVLPQISNMLWQPHSSDVLEAIEFIVTCNEFKIPNSNEAFWQCCKLIWSKDAVIKEAVIRSFQRLYLTNDIECPKAKSAAIVKSLITLVSETDLSQRTSLEEIMCELVKLQYVTPAVCRALWECFTARPGTATAKAALKLIGMMAKADKAIVGDNFDILVDIGLGDKAMQDFELARDACIAVEKMALLPKARGEDAMKIEPYRLPQEHVLFNRLYSLIVDGYVRIEDPIWEPMMEKAVHVIYRLAERPDQLAERILKAMMSRLRIEEQEISDALLARVLAIIGHVALETFIFLDVTVCRELKRRALLTSEALVEKAKQRHCKLGSPASVYSRQIAVKTPRSKVSTMVSSHLPTTDGENNEEELGAMVGTTADDQEYEFVYKMCEEEVLAEKSILGNLSQLVLLVCNSPDKYRSADVQSAASLALSKLMVVSSKFCESHLQLFFTLMDRSECPAVRANLVAAVGDLSFRFPNLVEPWTGTVYNRLHDSDLNVRLNCLLVLNHLILNDMIKPKGFVADMAQCILDGNASVVALAKKFFHEYAEKANSLYNLMPDIISRLSDPSTNLEMDDFKCVMKFLFSLIHKERQYESLVEKLCQRFLTTESVDQWRQLSYCLTLPSYNERCLKKLQDNLACYANKLGNEEVNENFSQILNHAKKGCKQEAKVIIEELEQKFDELHQKFEENQSQNLAVEADVLNISEHKQRLAKNKRKHNASKGCTPARSRRSSRMSEDSP